MNLKQEYLLMGSCSGYYARMRKGMGEKRIRLVIKEIENQEEGGGSCSEGTGSSGVKGARSYYVWSFSG
jgi:hypothetical protein